MRSSSEEGCGSGIWTFLASSGLACGPQMRICYDRRTDKLTFVFVKGAGEQQRNRLTRWV